MYKSFLIVFIILTALLSNVSALWCYQCISNEPGCGTPFNWLWHWTKVCPEDDDVCVKINERKDGTTVTTRGCLSTFQALRKDIPADHYEGCRPAAFDPHLSNYVNNSIKELDIKKDYYDSTEWCFCFLDHRCNSAFTTMPSIGISLVSVLVGIYNFW